MSKRKKKERLARASVYLRADVLEGLKASGTPVSTFIREATTRAYRRGPKGA